MWYVVLFWFNGAQTVRWYSVVDNHRQTSDVIGLSQHGF